MSGLLFYKDLRGALFFTLKFFYVGRYCGGGHQRTPAEGSGG